MERAMLRIQDILIGEGEPVLVIPEIGINHGGNLNTAKEMVDAAYRAGARMVKHQTHIAEDEMCAAARKVIPGNSDRSIYQIMKECSLSEEEEWELMQYTKSKGMVFLSTPFSRAAADRLEGFGVSAYKIGSGEMNNYPLLEHIAGFKKPMIVSTGMNTLAQVAKAADIMEKKGVDYAFMHTTNLYPTKPSLVRLGAMQQLMKEFPHIPVGLSDHTVNNYACIAAMGLGAHLVERHFTDRMDRMGPDICCSMDEPSLKELLCAAAEIPQMLGGLKEPSREEDITIAFAFATVVTIKEIKKGELFTKDNLWVKRPGTGELSAEQYNSILGRKATEYIPSDTQLKQQMIEG